MHYIIFPCASISHIGGGLGQPKLSHNLTPPVVSVVSSRGVKNCINCDVDAKFLFNFRAHQGQSCTVQSQCKPQQTSGATIAVISTITLAFCKHVAYSILFILKSVSASYTTIQAFLLPQDSRLIRSNHQNVIRYDNRHTVYSRLYNLDRN